MISASNAQCEQQGDAQERPRASWGRKFNAANTIIRKTAILRTQEHRGSKTVSWKSGRSSRATSPVNVRGTASTR